MCDVEVIGPFIVTENGDNAEDDLLSKIGSAEANFDPQSAVFDAASMKRLDDLGNSTDLKPSVRKSVSSPYIDFRYFYGIQYGPNARIAAAAYVAFAIDSPAEDKCCLMFGSSDTGAAVWVNNKPVYLQKVRRPVEAYDDTCEIDLKKGINICLIKVWSGGGDWGLTCHIEPSVHSAIHKLFRLQDTEEAYILRRNFYRPGDTLIAGLRGIPQGTALKAEFINQQGEKVSECSCKQGEELKIPPELSEGLCKFVLCADDLRVFEWLFIGDCERFFERLVSRAKLLHENPQYGPTIQSLVERCAIQLRPINRPLQPSHVWDRRMLYTLRELDNTITAAERNDDYGKQPGLHIRGFISSIDGLLETYRIYIPSVANRAEPVPVAFMLPTTTSAKRPFIESVFMAAHNEAERLGALAERYHLAIVWVGYRNTPQALPSESVHLNEVMHDVSSIVNVDDRRLYLFGACSTGAFATLAAERAPVRFAGIGLLDPMFAIAPPAEFDDGFAGRPEYVRYLRSRQPLFLMTKINLPPYYIINDGSEPGHGDISVSRAFAEAASSIGQQVFVKLQPRTISQHLGAWESILSKLSATSLPDRTSTLQEISQPGDALSAALSQKFLLVRGSIGSTEELICGNKIADAFQDAWKSTYFGRCKERLDVEVTENDKREFNLVLIGNPRSNDVWANLAERLPIKTEDQTVIIGTDRIDGDRLSIQAVCRSPCNPERRVVLIGAPVLQGTIFPNAMCAVQGWYSVGVWETKGLKTHLMLVR